MLETGYCRDEESRKLICTKYSFIANESDSILVLRDEGVIKGAAVVAVAENAAVIISVAIDEPELKDFFLRSLLFAVKNTQCMEVIVKYTDDSFLKFGFACAGGVMQALASDISLKGECSE